MFFLFHLLRGAIHQLQQWAQHRATVLDIFLHAPRASSCQGLEELRSLNDRLVRADKLTSQTMQNAKQRNKLLQCETLRNTKMQNGHLVSIFSEVLQKTGSTSLWQAFPVNLNVAGRDDETTRRLQTQAPCTLQQQPQQRRGAAFQKVWSSLAHCELDRFFPFFTNIIQSSKYVNTCQYVYCTVY